MATLAPLLAADPAIQIHAFAAMGAVGLTPFVLFRSRRDRLHKILGYGWITLLLVTAVSSFWISGIQVIGRFSPIHLLSVFTLVGLWQGLSHAIARRRAAHEAAMRGIALWGLGVAGLLAFLPGRLMNRVVFGDAGELGFALLIVIAALAAAFRQFSKPRARV